ncbi:MAG: PKD domain-containing protein [Lacibacter sp.]
MKKVIYSFIALLLAFSSIAQNTNPCAGKANFQLTVNGNTVSFYSGDVTLVALPRLFHSWNFGDGLKSDAQNPVHTYASAGTYRVVHYVKDTLNKCYDSAVKEITITTSVCDLLQPKFEWRKDSSSPAKIIFINQSLPNPPPSTIIYKWSFGDGTTSSERNPSHIYSTPGQYNVCLTISYSVAGTSNTPCTKTFCSVVTVVSPCNFKPEFTWDAAASNLLLVKFTNKTVLTTNAAQAKWSFGDGTYSTEWNPSHTYSKGGVYKVCLVVTTANNCTLEICKEITVKDCNFPADFRWALDSIYPMRGVKFYPELGPLTVMPLSTKWNFGDGATSTEYSPLHQYQQPGTYKVCLRVEFITGCVKEICKEVVVPLPANCEVLSKFVVERISSDPNTYIFKAETNLSTIKYTWTFGDGTGATGAYAKHQFDRSGKYTVCLTAYRGDNCASTTCKEIVVGVINCDQTVVKFETQRLNPPMNNAVKFIALSNQPIVSQSWTIWKSNATTPVKITTPNPMYVFQDTGTYKVCLRATTANGCVKEYCDVIRITQVPDVCTLQVMPNPATTSIQFKVQVEVAQPVVASIIDMTGVRKAVFYLNAVPSANTFTLPIATLPTGFYTLEVKIGNKVCSTKFQKVN